MAFNRWTYIFLIGCIAVPFFLWKCRTSDHVISPMGDVIDPVDNARTLEKIELGRKLFFDKRLSLDNSISCSSCHEPRFAFTDRKAVSNGIKGRVTTRNSPTIVNSGYLETIMFDAHLTTLEIQVPVPIQEHVEMGITMIDLIERMRKVPEYVDAALSIYDREFDGWVLTRSIAAFERSLVSVNSRFDQYYYQGNKSIMNSSEINGWKIFSEKLYCTQCHPAPHFTTYKAENNGLYADYGEDKGRFRIHHDSLDIGKFKIPSLRNVELTFPYMHDGSLKSFEQVIDHYSRGGNKHYLQNKVIVPFNLSQSEKSDLKSFLRCLTDTSYMVDFRD